MRQSRKLDHLKYALDLGDGPKATGFSDLTLIHNCLPELAWEEVCLETTVGGLPLTHPVIFNAITGGATDVTKVNSQIATLASLTGSAMAVGSQYSAVETKEVWESYEVARRIHDKGILIANLGAHASVAQARTAVDMIGADALQIHLNAGQEITMAEGDRNFRNYLDQISAIAAKIGVPVIVKEVGCGIAAEQATLLARTGITVIDVGGMGGTNFIAIEAARSGRHDDAEMVSWGIPTAISAIETVSVLPDQIDLIVSGGIRTPLDCVKGLAIGGKAVAIAVPVLRLLREHSTPEGAAGWLFAFLDQVKRYMVLSGIRHVSDLNKVPLIISGYTKDWLTVRGIDITQYAKRKSMA